MNAMLSQGQQQYYCQMIEYFISLLIVLIVYLFYVCWIYPRRTIKTYVKYSKMMGYKVLEMPYHPFKFDLLAQIKKSMAQGDALKFYKEERATYDIIITNSLNVPRIEINHPDFLKDYYSVDKHYMYPKGRRVVEIFSQIAGSGLPFSEGEIWTRKRRILNKVLNFDFVKAQTHKIARACSRSIKQMERKSKISQNGSEVSYNILDLTVKMFSTVMMESFLGGTGEQMINNQPAGQFLKKILDCISDQRFSPLIMIFGSKYFNLGITKSQRQIHRMLRIFRQWGLPFIRNKTAEITKAIEQKRLGQGYNDIISALILAKYNSPSENSEELMISEQQILEEFSTFMGAGTDTTSIYVQQIIYVIAKHPEIQTKIRKEIQTYMKEEDYSYDNLKNFKYLEMVQKQVTRFYGPGTNLFMRVAKQDNTLNGLPIKKGTSLNIPIICNHFNPAYFPNPGQFRPERWESECDNLPSYVAGGFSAGARTCIGKHLVLIQSKIAVIKFMKRYKKIILGKQNFNMVLKFLYGPEDFESKMIIDPQYQL